jgi:hypothetical protein
LKDFEQGSLKNWDTILRFWILAASKDAVASLLVS